MDHRKNAVIGVSVVVFLALLLIAISDNKQDTDKPNAFFETEQNSHRSLKFVLDPKSVAPKNPAVNFYIDVATFTEGFSGWKHTLGQILNMIETIPGASLVEPCMMGGLLVSCTTPYPEKLVVEGESFGPVPISEILDISRFLQPKDGQPSTVTLYSDFLQRTQHPEDNNPVKHFYACLKASQKECPAPYGTLNGHDRAHAKNDEEISVYTVFTCWWGRCALELSKNFKGVGDRHMKLPAAPLDFHPQLVNTVKDVLASANILNDFSLVHWRGERKHMDYIKCANTVVAAKNNMSNMVQQQQQLSLSENHHPFLLMTSLNENINMQWNGELIKNRSDNGTPTEALAILEQNGFIRFDKLLKDANIQVKDPGMLAFYDLILATLSSNFSTCANASLGETNSKGGGAAEGCSAEQYSTCHACNYMGKFARLAVDMRMEAEGHDASTTSSCWPV